MPDGRTRDELSSVLRALRSASGRSGVAVAEETGMSQASLSRYETGRQVPDPDTVAALCHLYGATSETRDRLHALASDLWQDASPRARAVRKQASNMQRRIGRIEQASGAVAVFQPIVVPGLLQTSAYARAVFLAGGVENVDEAVRERMNRRHLLDDTAKTFTLLMSEGVPRWPLGSPTVMRDQIDHIINESRRGNLRVGIVGAGALVDAVPMSGFDVYDDRAAVVATNAGTSFYTDPSDVGSFVDLFRKIAQAASYDDEARRLLRGARRALSN